MVRSAYNMLVTTRIRREAWLEGSTGTSNMRANEGAWKALWKTEVPSKVRMFLWRLSKQSLPTKDVRAHRNMSTSCTCGFCGAPDSWRHSLLDCTVSRCTWALADEELGINLAATTEERAKSWLFSLLDTLPHDKFILLSVTFWAIWTSRRKAIHEAIFQTPHAIHAFIKRFIADLDAVRAPKSVRHTRASTSSVVQRPKAPPAPFAKIHVDAALRTYRGGSVVAICRDINGDFMGSSALVVLGEWEPATLEAIACWGAIALAEDLNTQRFVVASDCKQVIGDITKGYKGSYGSVISEIRTRSSQFLCNFSFESRQVNFEAHKLARFSLSLAQGRHVWLGQAHDQT